MKKNSVIRKTICCAWLKIAIKAKFQTIKNNIKLQSKQTFYKLKNLIYVSLSHVSTANKRNRITILKYNQLLRTRQK